MKKQRNKPDPERISVVQRRKHARRARKSAFAMYFFTYSGSHPNEQLDQETIWTKWQALSPEQRAAFEESSRRCWD